MTVSRYTGRGRRGGKVAGARRRDRSTTWFHEVLRLNPFYGLRKVLRKRRR